MTQVNPAPVFRAAYRIVREEAAMAMAIVVAVGASLVFLDVADDSAEPAGRAFDQAVLQWLHPGPNHAEPVGPEWFDHAVRDLTSLGSLAVLATLSVIVLGYLLLQRKRLEAVSLVISLGGGLGLSQALKQAFDRSRPPLEWHAAETLNASFPSGHALLSTVFFLTLGVMLARATKKAGLRVYILGVAVALAFLVGASRIYLGVHWTSDVFAGWSLGAAWAMTCWLVERSVARRMTRNTTLAPTEDDAA